MYHSHWACPPTRLPGDDGTILFRRDLPLIITMTISILQWNVRGFKSQRPYLISYPFLILSTPVSSASKKRTCNLTPLPLYLTSTQHFVKIAPVAGWRCCHFLLSSLPHIPLLLQSPLEVVATQIFLSGHLLIICSLYIPPVLQDLSLNTELANLYSALPQPFILCADVNAHHPLWSSSRRRLCMRHGSPILTWSSSTQMSQPISHLRALSATLTSPSAPLT